MARIAAARALLEYGHGRPPVQVDVNAAGRVDHIVYRSEAEFREALLERGIPARLLPPPVLEGPESEAIALECTPNRRKTNMNLPTQLPFTSEAADLYLRQLQVRARKDFATFRSLKRPTMHWGWWTEEVARELMRFYRALTEGRRPKLALMAPPQHGKSWTIWDFIAWIAGKHPAFKTIFASYSEELGIVANAELQRTIRSSFFSGIFPGTRIDVPGWQCNNNLIEFVDHGGSFRNTTVTGQVTGFGLDLGVIDDPVKGRGEANSKLIRDRTWNWFTDDFFNQFAANAGLLIIMTRWHVDDLLGRLLAKFGDEVRVLRYPAIAEADEFNDRGKLLRRKGEALFPQHKPLDFLLERKKLETQASWESLFQQIQSSPAAVACRSISFAPYRCGTGTRLAIRSGIGIRRHPTKKMPLIQRAC